MTQIVVVGASGKLGRAIVTAALSRGFRVTGLVRNRTKAERLPAGVAIVEGDGRDPAALARAFAGAEVVVIPAGGRADPVTAEIVRAALPAMKAAGTGRVIVVSAYGAFGEPGFYGWLMRTAAKAVSADKMAAEAALRSSDLDWTAVRPGVLTDGPATGRVKAASGARLRGLPRVSRADVAAFIIGEVERPAFTRQSPVVSV